MIVGKNEASLSLASYRNQSAFSGYHHGFLRRWDAASKAANRRGEKGACEEDWRRRALRFLLLHSKWLDDLQMVSVGKHVTHRSLSSSAVEADWSFS